MSPADRAWLTLAAGITAWDLTCPPGQTLSAAASRYHRRRPWLTRTAIAYLGLHLLGVIPARVDPLHTLTRVRTTPHRRHAHRVRGIRGRELSTTSP